LFSLDPLSQEAIKSWTDGQKNAALFANQWLDSLDLLRTHLPISTDTTPKTQIEAPKIVDQEGFCGGV
jgi:hypothetical protein